MACRMFYTLPVCKENPISNVRSLLNSYQYGYINSVGRLCIGMDNYQNEKDWRNLLISPQDLLEKKQIGNCLDIGLFLHKKIPEIIPCLRLLPHATLSCNPNSLHVYPLYKYRNTIRYVIVKDIIRESNEYTSLTTFFQHRFLNNNIKYYDFYAMINIPNISSAYRWGSFIEYIVNHNKRYRVYRF